MSFNRIEHLKRIARRGGLARIRLHGNPGSVADRHLGGVISSQMHKKLRNGFKTLKKIPKVDYSSEVAELLGILMGDGHLGEYQVTMTTNSQTDLNHAIFVRDKFRKIFKITPSFKKRKDKKALIVCLSSKEACSALEKLGMPRGNKIKGRMSVPEWIKKDPDYVKAFIRGVFDTDGCVYIDTHRRGNKRYQYLGWTITSYADIFLADLGRLMLGLGFHTSNTKNQKSLYLRKQREILEYFTSIGTHNEKHKIRFSKFLKIHRRGVRVVE